MSAALMPFVESTLAAAIQRLNRVDAALEETMSAPTVEDLARMQANVLMAIEHVQSAMRMMDLPAPPKNHNPTLRLVR